jgi:hypothetical protein
MNCRYLKKKCIGKCMDLRRRKGVKEYYIMRNSLIYMTCIVLLGWSNEGYDTWEKLNLDAEKKTCTLKFSLLDHDHLEDRVGGGRKILKRILV